MSSGRIQVLNLLLSRRGRNRRDRRARLLLESEDQLFAEADDASIDLLAAEISSWNVSAVDASYAECKVSIERLRRYAEDAGPQGFAAMYYLRYLALLATESVSIGSAQHGEPVAARPRQNRFPGVALCQKLPPNVKGDPRQSRRERQRVVVSAIVTLSSTMGACLAVAYGRFVLGAGIIVVRIALNSVVANPVFPLDYKSVGPKTASTSFRSIFFGYLTTQVCDVLMVVSISGYFVARDRAELAIVPFGASLLMILGTFARTSALAVGIRVGRRVYIERVARLIPLVVGLILARVIDPKILLAACLIPAFYGVVEGVRIVRSVCVGAVTEVGFITRQRTIGENEEISYEVAVAPEPRTRTRRRGSAAYGR